MNKTFISVLGAAVLTCVSQASVNINLGVGELYGTSTSTIFPDGGLVQLIVSTGDASFSIPTAGSFVSGDDIVLGNFDLQSGVSGAPGALSTALSINYSGSLAAGESLLVRWFPTLTLGSVGAGPAAGTIFGQYRTDSAIDGSSTGWFLPADGQTVALNFLTLAVGGSSPESLGLSSSMVTAVPEPATYAAILGLVTLGLVGYRRFRRS